MIMRALLIAFSIIAICVREVDALYKLSPQLFSLLASFGLLLLTIILFDTLISAVSNRASLRRVYILGLMFGFASGVFGAIPYAINSEFNFVAFMRVVAVSTFVGAVLHFLLITVLNSRYRLSNTLVNNVWILTLAAMGVAGLTYSTVSNLSEFGSIVRDYISLGFIDWVGSGSCDYLGQQNPSCKQDIGDMRQWNYLLILFGFSLLEVVYFSNHIKLSYKALLRSIVLVSGPSLIILFFLVFFVDSQKTFDRLCFLLGIVYFICRHHAAFCKVSRD